MVGEGALLEEDAYGLTSGPVLNAVAASTRVGPDVRRRRKMLAMSVMRDPVFWLLILLGRRLMVVVGEVLMLVDQRLCGTALLMPSLKMLSRTVVVQLRWMVMVLMSRRQLLRAPATRRKCPANKKVSE